MIRPGESGRVLLYFESQFNATFSFRDPGNLDQVINWDAAKDASRPTFIQPDAWDVIWSRFTAAAGPTIRSYQAYLGQIASYLSRLGITTNDPARLASFAIELANDFLAGPALDRDTVSRHVRRIRAGAKAAKPRRPTRCTLHKGPQRRHHRPEHRVTTDSTSPRMPGVPQVACVYVLTHEAIFFEPVWYRLLAHAILCYLKTFAPLRGVLAPRCAIGLRDTTSNPGERVTSFTFDQFQRCLDAKRGLSVAELLENRRFVLYCRSATE